MHDTLPLPTVTADNRPFFEGARAGRLMLPVCDECHRPHLPPGPVCPFCFSGRLSWRAASGRGTVSSFVIVHQPWFPAFRDRLPYNVAQIELAEGPRLTADVVDLGERVLAVGMPVAVVFDPVDDTLTLPRFRPCPA